MQPLSQEKLTVNARMHKKSVEVRAWVDNLHVSSDKCTIRLIYVGTLHNIVEYVVCTLRGPTTRTSHFAKVKNAELGWHVACLLANVSVIG